jgi:hypothetical protein
MRRRTPRLKRYGLTQIGLQLSIALWWIVFATAMSHIKPSSTVWNLTAIFFGFIAVPIALYMFDGRLSRAQQARDLARAMAAIKKPLRNAILRGGPPIDFDPHYPAVRPTGTTVIAIDPRRRFIRMIMSNVIDLDGKDLDEASPVEGKVTKVQMEEVPGPRRWMWLLPAKKEDARLRLSVTVQSESDPPLTVPFFFRVNDAAATGWRRTFERWMQEDQARPVANSTPSAC